MKKIIFVLALSFITSLAIAATPTEQLASLNSQIGNARSTAVAGRGGGVESLITERRSIMLSLAGGDPQTFLEYVLSSNVRASAPRSVLPAIESAQTIDGTLSVVSVDNFKQPNNVSNRFFLSTSNGVLQLSAVIPPKFESGSRLRISGYRLDNYLVTGGGKNEVSLLAAPPKNEALGEQKTLVFLIKLSDSSPNQPFTAAQAKTLIFNDQFDKFIREESYNKTWFTGDVYGWVTLSKAGSNQSCGYVSITDNKELQDYIVSHNINLNNYGRILYLQTDSGGACSGVGRYPLNVGGTQYRLSETWLSGMGSYGDPSGWGRQPYKWSNLDFLLAHELGHALGVVHANGWDCGSDMLYGQSCSHLEYGGLFDAMGSGPFSQHYNAFFKEQLGWFPGAGSQVKIKQSGKYIIKPVELNNGSNYAGIYNRPDGKANFYVEYRQPIGFDAILAGQDFASSTKGIVLSIPFGGTTGRNSWAPSYRLLDLKPTDQTWWDDIKYQASLNDGETFSDPDSGVTLDQVRSLGQTGVSFRATIKTPVCVNHPLVPDLTSNYEVNAGSDGYIYGKISSQNGSACSVSAVPQVRISSADGWLTQYVSSFNDSEGILPGDVIYGSINYEIPSTARVGSSQLNVDIKDLTTGLTTQKQLTVFVLPNLQITKLSPNNIKPGVKVELLGQGFPKSPQVMIWHPESGDSVSFDVFAVDTNGSLPGYEKIVFTFPKQLYHYECPDDNSGCTTKLVDFTPGDYRLRVLNNGATSNEMKFTVADNSRSTITVLDSFSGQLTQGTSVGVSWTDSDTRSSTYAVLLRRGDGKQWWIHQGAFSDNQGKRTFVWPVGSVNTDAGVNPTTPDIPGNDYFITICHDYSAPCAYSNHFSLVGGVTPDSSIRVVSSLPINAARGSDQEIKWTDRVGHATSTYNLLLRSKGNKPQKAIMWSVLPAVDGSDNKTFNWKFGKIADDQNQPLIDAPAGTYFIAVCPSYAAKCAYTNDFTVVDSTSYLSKVRQIAAISETIKKLRVILGL